MTTPPIPIPNAPPPWSTKCTAYVLGFHTSSSRASLPQHAYTSLSASHAPFSAEAECGAYKGGLGMIQVLRYSETPVGPYDELAVLPGYFDVPVGKRGCNSRVTAIWVSQKETCWNGRKNWNMPKHLARFKFTPSNNSTSASTSSPLKIEVFPEDPSITVPFFTASFQPLKWLPSFPYSSAWLSYLGLDTNVVQPPLPEGETLELCGTKQWKKANPVLRSQKTRLVWIDMKQPLSQSVFEGNGDEERDALLGKEQKSENWWPGLRRWNIGLWFDDATLELGEPEILTSQ